MSTELQASHKSLYEADFVRWVETTVEQLRTKDYAVVDWANLIEEIEDLKSNQYVKLRASS